MNLGDSFDCVEAIELESSSIECLGKVAVAGKVFLLNLEPSRPRTSVIHVICSEVRRANTDSAWRVL